MVFKELKKTIFMKRLEPVSKIMTKELVTLCLHDDLYKAEKLFKKIDQLNTQRREIEKNIRAY